MGKLLVIQIITILNYLFDYIRFTDSVEYNEVKKS